MRLFYLISAIVIAVLILVISFAQIASTCTWSLIGANASPVFVLLQVAGLGAVMGGLLVLFWKAPKDNDDEVSSSEIKGE
jgi:protein-S-isoprenylcysteine O-methyltransferase Ste14